MKITYPVDPAPVPAPEPGGPFKSANFAFTFPNIVLNVFFPATNDEGTKKISQLDFVTLHPFPTQTKKLLTFGDLLELFLNLGGINTPNASTCIIVVITRRTSTSSITSRRGEEPSELIL